MSLIRDVREELRGLDVSRRSLRKFGLLVGAVLILIAAVMTFRGSVPPVRTAVGALGLLLAAAGLAVPGVLQGVYRVWMAVAFTLGWAVSRVLLALVFFLVLTPTGLLARVLGKKFLEVQMHGGQPSYWVPKGRDRKVNYEKMY